MRITIITETFTPDINGVAKTLNQLTTGLEKNGHQIHVICPYNPAREFNIIPTSVSIHAVNGLPIPGYSEARLGLPSKKYLHKFLSANRPDVIYVATEGPLGWAAVKEANKQGIPVISGFHTNFHTYSKHYGIGFLKNIVESYLVSLHNKSGSTLTPTDDQKKILQTMGIDNVSVLGRGVDANLFSPLKRDYTLRQKWGASNEQLVLLYVGRIAAEKNLNLALKTYQALLELDKGIKFVMVGDGPLYKTFRNENPRIIFTGTLQGEKLASHYASADMFVFPSLTETFGNVILEAMASGLGILAYDYAAAHQHIKSDHNGLLAGLNNEQEFADNAKRYLNSRLLLQKLRKNAYTYAQQQTWPDIIRRFETILNARARGKKCNWVLAS